LTTNNFLSSVLPTEGTYCVMGLKKDGKPKQKFTETLEELELIANEMLQDAFDVYFALASYEDSTAGRTNNNALYLKSFFLDLDCGLGKPYASQEDALVALKKFIKELGLPKPTLVNSGRGVHVYWVLDQSITRAEWKPVAESLKALCTKHNLHADPAVTADVARILRLPGTANFKDPENPLTVQLLMQGNPIAFETIKESFHHSEDIFSEMGEVPQHLKRGLDPMTKLLMENHQYKFKTIFKLSLEGKGCAQILNAYENQESLEEPLWRAALSIASRCSDREKAIDIISNKHPDYNPEQARRKADATKGPYTCETYKKLNPAGCEGCPHKIGTPLQLGAELIEPPKEAQVVTEETENGTVREYQIPEEFPFPYSRGSTTGVYMQAKDEDGNKTTELVCKYFFYAVSHIDDPDAGHTLLLRLHLPQDGVKEFLMPYRDLMAKDRFRDIISEHGLIALGKDQDKLMNYIAKWAEHLQSATKSEKARKQFGWLDDDSAFILGDKEITAEEVKYSPPTGTTLPLVPMFGEKGDFHIWKDVINAYARQDMEARAFAFFMGFGNMLLKYTPLEGYALSLMSQKSGTGKTTVLHAIGSIFGNPKEGWMMLAKDTHNQKIQRVGTMRHIPILFDEMTQLTVEAKSDLVYDITQGRGKNRMRSSENAERINNTKWATGIICTTNRSLRDDILSIKAMPEGELMRILELRVLQDPMDNPAWSRAHFNRLYSNYGHAVKPFIQYVLDNLPEVIAFVEKIQQKIEQAADMKSNERYWSIQAALAISAGIITRKLGLHDIDHRPVLKFIVNHIIACRKQNQQLMEEGSDFLGNLLQRRFHEILVINGAKDARTGLESGPIREPRGALTARYEPDTHLLCVSSKEYRAECAKWKVNFEESLERYKKSGAYLGMKRKRMSSGTTMDANVNIHALWFDSTKLDFFNKEELLNASGDGSDVPDTVEDA
jgi:hypothetical protein